MIDNMILKNKGPSPCNRSKTKNPYKMVVGTRPLNSFRKSPKVDRENNCNKPTIFLRMWVPIHHPVCVEHLYAIMKNL